HDVDGRARLLAIELHGVGAGARVGLPVDPPWVVARRIRAVILELERAAAPGAEPWTGTPAPEWPAEAQAERAGRLLGACLRFRAGREKRRHAMRWSVAA